MDVGRGSIGPKGPFGWNRAPGVPRKAGSGAGAQAVGSLRAPPPPPSAVCGGPVQQWLPCSAVTLRPVSHEEPLASSFSGSTRTFFKAPRRLPATGVWLASAVPVSSFLWPRKPRPPVLHKASSRSPHLTPLASRPTWRSGLADAPGAGEPGWTGWRAPALPRPGPAGKPAAAFLNGRRVTHKHVGGSLW